MSEILNGAMWNYIDGKTFCIQKSIFKKCARLEMRTNKWDSMLSMLSQRFYSTAVIVDDINVFGGGLNVGSRVEHIKSVERYNMHNNIIRKKKQLDRLSLQAYEVYKNKPPFKERYEWSRNYILQIFNKLGNEEKLLRVSLEELCLSDAEYLTKPCGFQNHLY
uniref:Uncharacterized protein n=1 Tax=Glossina pallidipes TaxID=7398 RepID=A0A1A9ZXI4_GLOPL